jgi:hypothetical protein
VLLFGFNYAYSQESKSQICKNACKVLNDPNFCKRICEIELSNLKWKFLDFNALGDAFFYNLETVSVPKDIVKGWIKIVFSEKGKQKWIKSQGEFGKMYKNLDYSLTSYEIDCSQKKCRLLETIDYASNGSIIISGPNPEREWKLIPSNSIMEDLFKKVCR